MINQAEMGSFTVISDFKNLSNADLEKAGVDQDLRSEIDKKIRYYNLQKNRTTGSYTLDRSGVPLSDEERREKQRKADEEAEARDNAERDHIYEHSR